jgi:serine/threonine protein kinase
LLKPVEDIEEVVGVTAILTTYYELTLKHVSIVHWKGREVPIKRLAKGLCHGLHHMHQRGFAHRDIKPDNILLQNVGGDPVIIDFGLSNATEPGAGTSKYLAPE